MGCVAARQEEETARPVEVPLTASEEGVPTATDVDPPDATTEHLLELVEIMDNPELDAETRAETRAKIMADVKALMSGVGEEGAADPDGLVAAAVEFMDGQDRLAHQSDHLLELVGIMSNPELDAETRAETRAKIMADAKALVTEVGEEGAADPDGLVAAMVECMDAQDKLSQTRAEIAHDPSLDAHDRAEILAAIDGPAPEYSAADDAPASARAAAEETLTFAPPPVRAASLDASPPDFCAPESSPPDDCGNGGGGDDDGGGGGGGGSDD